MTLHYYNGTALYRTSVLDGITLESSGFFYAAELLVKTIHRGYLFAEVPYALLSRASGVSTAVTLKSLIAVTRGYLSTLWSVRFADNRNRCVLSPDSATALRLGRLSNPAGVPDLYSSDEPRAL